MIKIAIVDDHSLFRKGMASLLEESGEFKVIMEAGDGRELLDKLAESQPEVILLDLNMPVMDGSETLSHLKDQFPDIKVIILSMHQEDAMILHLMKEGAHGYLLKESEPEEVELAIRSVLENGFYFNDNVSRIMLAGLTSKNVVKPRLSGGVELTDREMEVLREVCLGLTNAEIAEKLFLSPRTVEGHRKNIMEKMNVKNTAGMVVYAIKLGWVDPEEIDPTR